MEERVDIGWLFWIANEYIDSRNGMAGVVCQVDMEKAYSHINWNFFGHLLGRMGLGQKWWKWIWVCIPTALLMF